MSTERPRLVIIRNAERPGDEALEALRVAFMVEEVEAGAAPVAPNAWTLTRGEQGVPGRLRAVLERIGEGVGLYEDDGEAGRIAWCNARLEARGESVRRIFAATCRLALRALRNDPDTASRRYAFADGPQHFELVVSPAETGDDAPRSVVGVLREVTREQRVQSKIDAIDAAGGELLKIDTESIRRLNLAERLRLLEDRIVRTVKETLRFDNFEVRLVDRRTRRLELVFLRGLSPLRIGEVLYAEETENGICGWVAATGRSYLCTDVEKDPRYHEGLTGARSSLTVPLRLHDQVIGVLNVESVVAHGFDDQDRQFAEIYGRYVALAMHILDLLVVERCTTNEQLGANVIGEVEGPLAEIRAAATSLRARLRGARALDRVDEILDATDAIARRLETCVSGPKSIIGAEPESDAAADAPDPDLLGKRILLVDDEPVVLEAIRGVLARKGCAVDACADGRESIERIAAGAANPYDLVISDIRMGERNGYEVFRATKAACADTPVILMTGFGYDPHHSIVRASQEGLHSFLFKPLKASQLIEAVRSAVAPKGAGA